MKYALFQLRVALGCAAVLAGASCQATGFTSFLKTGSADQKTTLLASADASREEQALAQGQFQTTYHVFGQLLDHETEDQHALYEEFLDQVDACAQHAGGVKGRISELREEASDFFGEWKVELEQFSSAKMREHSEEMLSEAEETFELFVQRLQVTDDQMQAVLVAWRDYVLFFSHNLNERALTALEDQNEEFDESFEDLDEAFAEARAGVDEFFRILEGR